MQPWIAMFGVLAACGNVGATRQDASVPLDAAGQDAHAPVCDPTGKFDTPIQLAGLHSEAHELTPRLTLDELELYFTQAQNNESDFHLYRTQRNTTNKEFGTPVALTAVNSTGNDFNPSISNDGLTLFFESRSPGVLNHLYTSSRASRLGEFGIPSKMANVNSTSTTEREVQPFVTADGEELWFASDRMGGLGGDDIYRATRNGVNFSNVSAVTALSTNVADELPTLSADKLTIYLASERASAPGKRDIWTSHRMVVSDGFPTPTPVSELNTDSDDLVGWLSPDNCRLYFSSNRAGTYDIYVATRHPM